MDINPERTFLGPRLYFRERLEHLLGNETIERLKQKIFQITAMKSTDDSAYGQIDGIELFGKSRNDVDFMKFDYYRMEPASRTAHVDRARDAIADLRYVLDDRSPDVAEWANFGVGDVLVVNNWRVATAWDDECRIHINPGLLPDYGGQIRAGRLTHVHRGDRVVFQMNFYLPREEFAAEDPTYSLPPRDRARSPKGGHH
jgi:hypothetical protein